MSQYKSSRNAEDVKREITAIIRELKDPRVMDKMLTVVRIDMADDVSYAKVYVSAYEGLNVAKKACEGLTRASGLIKKELSKRLKIRKSPDLKFVPDDSVKQANDLWANFEKLTGGSRTDEN